MRHPLLFTQNKIFTFLAAEIGLVDASTVDVLLSKEAQATDAKAGVTIKVNSISATILTGVIQADKRHIYYGLSSPVVEGDLITWEYSKNAGNIQDLLGISLINISSKNVINHVFNDNYMLDFFIAQNSMYVPSR